MTSSREDRIPPQSIDTERSVLGAMLLSEDAVSVALTILRMEDFYRDAHRTIFAAMKELFDHAKPVEGRLIAEKLKKMGKLEDIGGMSYIADLSLEVSTGANIEHHAQIVKDYSLRRAVIRFGSQIAQQGYDQTISGEELVAASSKAMMSLFANEGQNREVFQKDVFMEVLDQWEAGGRPGIPTGYHDLDRKIGGFGNGDMIVIAGRPGWGKSWSVIGHAYRIAFGRTPVGIFSLEMTPHKLVGRIIATHTGISSQQGWHGKLEEDQYKKIVDHSGLLSGLPVIYDATRGNTVSKMRAAALRWKAHYGIKIILIDYLQLIYGIGNGDTEKTTGISRDLKSLAQELDIPVVVVSQLSRAIEDRGAVPRPKLSDLRQSGAIEQDADIVIFPWRPWVWIKDFDEDKMGSHKRKDGKIWEENDAVFIVAKNREGEIGDVNVNFYPHRGFWPEREEL